MRSLQRTDMETEDQTQYGFENVFFKSCVTKSFNKISYFFIFKKEVNDLVKECYFFIEMNEGFSVFSGYIKYNILCSVWEIITEVIHYSVAKRTYKELIEFEVQYIENGRVLDSSADVSKR